MMLFLALRSGDGGDRDGDNDGDDDGEDVWSARSGNPINGCVSLGRYTEIE